ncbi:hypothetical protein Cabys_3476 [Caldithrix abyssi DSM 13497]|uniref:Uncharacterized protein n=1 Tax=Caldithrix abyssi DSM 13497 TaxID=880073 RepID=A0A1J1CCE8_CALAY|nr:hypothetical protein Cabys_3476 [Caldithrix abyssi DSM 13497]
MASLFSLSIPPGRDSADSATPSSSLLFLFIIFYSILIS